MNQLSAKRGPVILLVLALALLFAALVPLLVLRAQGPTGSIVGIPYGSNLPGNCSPLSNSQNPVFFLTTQQGNSYPGLYACTGPNTYAASPNVLPAFFYNVAGSDFTTAANTNLQLITGLTWTMPANESLNVPFHCHLAYSQGTANAAVAFGVQDVTVAPTNLFATGLEQTNTTAFTGGNLPALTTTTATNIVSATPGATATVFNVDLNGLIEQPANASSSAIQIMVSTATSADAVTVKRGSFCAVGQ